MMAYKKFDSEFEIRYAIYAKNGGTKAITEFDSVYEIDEAILEQGGGGGGVTPEQVKEIAYEKQDGVYIEEQVIAVENVEDENSIAISPNNIIIAGGDGGNTIISKDGVQDGLTGNSVAWSDLFGLNNVLSKI